MKKHALLAITLIAVLFTHTAEAKKRKARMILSKVCRKESSAAITIRSSKEFIMGNKIYVLYIGSRAFHESEEDLTDPLSYKMTFYIPLSDYRALKKNSRVFLTYGYVDDGEISEEQMRAVCKANHVRCWSLGRFRHKKL